MTDLNTHIANINIIQELLDKNDRLSHASNILVKERDRANGKLNQKQENGLKDIVSQYVIYITGMLQNKGYSERVIRNRVELLNNYYNFIHTHGYDNLFTAQGKFRSTINEEFMYILFADYVSDLKTKYGDEMDAIHCGSAKAYTNLYFSATDIKSFIKSPSMEINVKDQDFAIYREISINIDGRQHNAKLPIAAIENKTYVDKTMLDSIIATAEKIKQGFPYARFQVVTEFYDVSLDVDPVYSRIDQIYVLRKCRHKDAWQDIDVEVVLKMFRDTARHIESPWSDIENNIRENGMVM